MSSEPTFIEQVSKLKKDYIQSRKNLIEKDIPRWIVILSEFLGKTTNCIYVPLTYEEIQTMQIVEMQNFATNATYNLRIIYADLLIGMDLTIGPQKMNESVQQQIKKFCMNEIRQADSQLFDFISTIVAYYDLRGRLAVKYVKHANSDFADSVKMLDFEHRYLIYMFLRIMRDNLLSIHDSLMKNAVAVDSMPEKDVEYHR